jgi:hypothetical protein
MAQPHRPQIQLELLYDYRHNPARQHAHGPSQLAGDGGLAEVCGGQGIRTSFPRTWPAWLMR